MNDFAAMGACVCVTFFVMICHIISAQSAGVRADQCSAHFINLMFCEENRMREQLQCSQREALNINKPWGDWRERKRNKKT